jgi:hypothetical protein
MRRRNAEPASRRHTRQWDKITSLGRDSSSIMPWRALSHSSRKIRRSAFSCRSGLSWSCGMTSARTSLGRSGPEGDPDVPLVRARQRGEPHPPKTPGRERISGPEAGHAMGTYMASPGTRPCGSRVRLLEPMV